MSDDARTVRHALADPWALVVALGLDAGAIREGRERVKVRCPWHAERSPSCSVRVARDGTIAVRCFGCDATGDALALVAVARGLDVRHDFRAVLAEAAELAGVTLETDERAGAAERREPRPVPPPPPRPYPPAGELEALLAACGPCARDVEVSAWLRGRGIEPRDVDRYGLAFALPRGARAPWWARFKGGREAAEPWASTGHRLVVPMVDHEGEVRSVRVRAVVATADPKTLPPSGFRASGLVAACPLARLVLQVGAWPQGVERRIVVAEGEPDWLTWATRGEGPRTLAAVGVTSGSWSPDLADRIPDGSNVILRTDRDDAGDRYAAELARSLAGRCRVTETYPAERAARRAARAADLDAKLRANHEAPRR